MAAFLARCALTSLPAGHPPRRSRLMMRSPRINERGRKRRRKKIRQQTNESESSHPSEPAGLAARAVHVRAGELDRQLLVGGWNWRTCYFRRCFQIRLRRRFDQTVLTKPSIFSAEGEQFIMPAAFNDSAVIEHQNLIRVDNGRKSMRDHDRCAVKHQAFG